MEQQLEGASFSCQKITGSSPVESSKANSRKCQFVNKNGFCLKAVGGDSQFRVTVGSIMFWMVCICIFISESSKHECLQIVLNKFINSKTMCKMGCSSSVGRSVRIRGLLDYGSLHEWLRVHDHSAWHKFCSMKAYAAVFAWSLFGGSAQPLCKDCQFKKALTPLHSGCAEPPKRLKAKTAAYAFIKENLCKAEWPWTCHSNHTPYKGRVKWLPETATFGNEDRAWK